MKLQNNTGTFYCGTSNVELPVRNKSFYPRGFQNASRLNYYASIFNSVEINSTFYRIPMPRTIEKWANDVPEHFRFTFKLWREITHAKELNYDSDNLKLFLASINMVGQKKGCLLIQFPASIKFSYFRNVKQLLSNLEATEMLEGWKVAIEFRDRSWYNDTVYQMLEAFDAAIVIHDMPKSSTPLIDMERSFVYLRFHGELGDYRGGYPNDILEEHATIISDWMNEGLPVFAYFNNTMGDAVTNAMSLTTFVNY